jgi:hypothetical protein
VKHDVQWWAAECNLAQAHVRIAREGLRLARSKPRRNPNG